MADVGERLRAAREGTGLTIADLSARTKIKPSTILAIEQGAFEQLPGEFFTRAFLRTYARELHLPVDEVMAEYDREHRPPAVSPEPPRSPGPDLTDPESSWRRAWPLAAVVTAGMLIVFVLTRPAPEASPGAAAVGTTGTSGSTPGSAVQAAAASGPAEAESLTIEIRPVRRLWVTGRADGSRVLYRMLEPGERVTIQARETMTFRVGDAGAFEYLLNGRPGKPPGRDGEVRDFTIDRSNHQQLTR